MNKQNSFPVYFRGKYYQDAEHFLSKFLEVDSERFAKITKNKNQLEYFECLPIYFKEFLPSASEIFVILKRLEKHERDVLSEDILQYALVKFNELKYGIEKESVEGKYVFYAYIASSVRLWNLTGIFPFSIVYLGLQYLRLYNKDVRFDCNNSMRRVQSVSTLKATRNDYYGVE